MKKWTIRIVIGLVVLAIVAVAGSFLFLDSIVKKGFETVGPKITQVDMHLGSAKISPFSGKCQLTDLQIGNPQGFKTPSAIKVGDMKVAVKASSLFSDVIQVDEVNIQGPEITFEAGLKGSNLGQILDNIKATSGGEKKEPTQTTKPSKNEKNIYIKNVVIAGGKINVSATVLGGKAVPLPLPTVHLENIGSQDKGETMAEASKQIMEAIVNSTTQASQQAISGLGKGLKDAEGTAKTGASNITEGVKGLFKR